MIKQQGGACRGILLNNYSSIVYSSSEKLFSLKHHFTLWTKGTHFMARRYLNTIWSEQFYDLNIDFFFPPFFLLTFVPASLLHGISLFINLLNLTNWFSGFLLHKCKVISPNNILLTKNIWSSALKMTCHVIKQKSRCLICMCTLKIS